MNFPKPVEKCVGHQHRQIKVAVPLGLAARPGAKEDHAGGLRDLDGHFHGKVNLLLCCGKLFESRANLFGGQHGGLRLSVAQIHA